MHRIRRVAVLGAGTMGAAIAAHCANAGLEVDLLDIAPDDPDADRNEIVNAGFERMKNARPAALMSKDVVERMRTGNFEDDFGRVGEADWVLEAILEKLEPKRELMERIEDVAKEGAIIPTGDTDPEVVESVRNFGERVLGKGGVIAKDTPNFIGNRLGSFAGMQSARYAFE